jgi:hypothetical protein
MSQLIDTILSEVCIDDRVSDGIFRLEEEEHMNALRDHFIRRTGLTMEDAIKVTNRMLEGKYPERQAYNKDGILVTFPTPKHKAKAIHARTHFEEDDAIRLGYLQKQDEPATRNAPAEEPPKNPVFSKDPEEPKEAPTQEPTAIEQGDNLLAIEPPRGDAKVETPPAPPNSPVTPAKTPEAKAAEKSVVIQMIKGDDSALTSLQHPSISEEEQRQINEVYEFAKEKEFTHVITLLDPHVK